MENKDINLELLRGCFQNEKNHSGYPPFTIDIVDAHGYYKLEITYTLRTNENVCEVQKVQIQFCSIDELIERSEDIQMNFSMLRLAYKAAHDYKAKMSKEL